MKLFIISIFVLCMLFCIVACTDKKLPAATSGMQPSDPAHTVPIENLPSGTMDLVPDIEEPVASTQTPSQQTE